jgi:hypothetical protein
MNDKPKVYVIHGKCTFPANTQIYQQNVIFPQMGHFVRRNLGVVGVQELDGMGIKFGENPEGENAIDYVSRVDILGQEECVRDPKYIEILKELGLEVNKLFNTDFKQAVEFFEEQTGKYLQGANDVIPFYFVNASIYGIDDYNSDRQAIVQLQMENEDNATKKIIERLVELEKQVVSAST